MSILSGIFIHRGFNFRTGKYDIGHNDDKNCVELKEFFNRCGINGTNESKLINLKCPAYFEIFDNVVNLKSDYVNTCYSTNKIYHNTNDFSISSSLYDSDSVVITNKNPNESCVIIKQSPGTLIHYSNSENKK